MSRRRASSTRKASRAPTPWAVTAAATTQARRSTVIITDTSGLLITVAVMAASRQDRDGAKTALLSAYLTTPVRYVFADQGFGTAGGLGSRHPAHHVGNRAHAR